MKRGKKMSDLIIKAEIYERDAGQPVPVLRTRSVG